MILIKSFIVILVIFILYYIFNKIKQQKNRSLEGMDNIGGSAPGVTNNDGMNKEQIYIGGETPVYKDPGLGKDPNYLAITNAANIAFLKSQIDGLSDIKQKIKELEAKVEQNSAGITQVGQSLANSSQQLTGVNPDSKEPLPEVTGLE